MTSEAKQKSLGDENYENHLDRIYSVYETVKALNQTKAAVLGTGSYEAFVCAKKIAVCV